MSTTCRSPGRPRRSASAGAPSITNPDQLRPRICGSCAASTNCISTTRLPAAGCCATSEPEGVSIGRRHAASLMKRIGIAVIYRRPSRSSCSPQIYPYLLRGVKIERADQVWAMDITYIPMARGFVYLAAVVDVFSRRVLAHRVSITMEADFCIEALEEALARHGKPDIFNSDQGSQFTSVDFTGVLLQHGVAISMDGRGAWRDNVFVERLWRSVKYEEVYLRAYDSVSEARNSISRYLAFYNHRRPHSSLDRRTPDEAYFTPSPLAAAA